MATVKGVKIVTFKSNHNLERSDEHYTPKILFDTLKINFGTDVCAPTGGVSWIPAVKYYDKEQDGLKNPWYGTVWMNPPFSKPAPWVEKFIKHQDGIALCVVSRSIWFNQLWNASDAIVPFPRTWKFERPDGNKKNISFQSFLFGIGNVAVEGMQNMPEYRVR